MVHLALSRGLLVGAGAAGAVALAATGAGAGEPRTFVLSNGLRVVLQVEEIPLVQVHVYYPVGPQTEPAGLEGIAHYLEHMMFVSSRNHPDGGLATELELLTTHRAASTRHAYTDYRSECIPELLEPLLRLEAERMGALDPSAAELAREKDVVLEEIAYRTHGRTPATQLRGEALRASFPGHPFGRRIEGTSESIGRVGEAEFRKYRDAFHGPTGAVLVVVGELDPDAVRRLVEEEFGSIPPNPVPPPDIPPFPERPDAVTVEIDRWDDRGLVTMLGFRLPRETDRDFVLVRLLQELFDDDFNVGLRALPGEYFLTLSASWPYRRTDFWGNEQPTDAVADAKRLYGAVWERVRDRIDEGLEEPAFEELVGETVARYRRARADPIRAADIAGRRWLLDERYPAGAVFAAAARALTPEEVEAYLEERVHPRRAVYGVSHGRDSGRLRDLPRPRRTGRDEEGSIVPARHLSAERVEPRLESYRRHFSEPIRTTTLSNGLTVHIVPVRGATYGLVGGTRTFPLLGDEKKGRKRGLTWAYNRLMRTVAAEKADDDRLPPSLRLRASPSSFRYSASSAPDRLEDSIRALEACLRNERLDVARWQDVHRWMDRTPRDQRLRPRVRADLRRWETMFGEKSPVLGILVPEPAEGKKITYKNMQELHRKLRRTEGLRLLVVTDPAHADQTSLLEETFGTGKAKGRKKPEPPRVSLDGIRGEVVSDFQERDVELTLTFPPVAIAPGADPAWAPMHLSRLIAETRLASRLREREGLVYYCRVRLTWVGDAALPEVVTASRPEDARRVYRIVREELQELVRSGVTEPDLLRARLALVKRRARWWSDAERAFEDLVGMTRYGAPPEDPVAAVLDAEREAVRSALESWIDPERYSFTLVGPLLEEEIGRF